MRMTRVILQLVLPAGLILGGLTVAAAQGTAEARQACTPDAVRLCSKFIPNAEKVKTCILHKRAQLSEACRVAISGGAREHRRRVHYRRHRVIHHYYHRHYRHYRRRR